MGALRALPAALVRKVWAAPLARFCVILFAALSLIVPLGTVFVVKLTQSAVDETELPSEYTRKAIEEADIFLPEEPDFLPEVLLPREQRPSWTVEDARPYWTNPAGAGQAFWLENAEKTIDTLLENIR
ncbi:MAG: hypothetical protein LBC72_05580 [Spirochaetaceae bacterium]|nr:hypothetical protein [Spirochaetaceae bacterium]